MRCKRRYTGATMPFRFTAGIVAIFSVICSACASSGGAIPVEQYIEEGPAANSDYVIAVGDMLSIQVFEQPNISGRMPVRADGRISLTFVNDIEAAGKTPTKLATDLEAALQKFVLMPRVTVVVDQSQTPTVSVLGEVIKPGTVPLERDTGVAQVLAAAGGLTTFADRDKIFVVRKSPKPVRIHFTYEALTQKVGPATTFRLRAGDVIVVE